MPSKDYLSKLSKENIFDCPFSLIDAFLAFDLEDIRGVLLIPSSSINKDIDLYLKDKLTGLKSGSLKSSKPFISSIYSGTSSYK
jgi:hypothetical protein